MLVPWRRVHHRIRRPEQHGVLHAFADQLPDHGAHGDGGNLVPDAGCLGGADEGKWRA